MYKKLLILMMLLPNPVFAATWATGDCTLSDGSKIKYMIHEGKGFITYDDKGPYEMFTHREGNIGIITHIGDSGNMAMAVDLNTGRGYIITKFDDGHQIEKNVSCKLSVVEK